ncbi:DMT family transporter [Novosphingobium terrae]|uniref:DMT family transporter n=1 Tax=Novosphingobium terrae TaxID=2726189 RepID=UPI00197DD8EF|nr:DMT family transporter [Novosphingobium terrae]
MLHISPQRKSLFSPQELALIGITTLWGATFLIVHIAMAHAGPLFFVGLRFVTAGGLSLVIFRKTLMKVTAKELVAGTAIGVAIFLGYALQTYGLKTINSSTSAFLTALYVPMVPLLQWGVMRRLPRAMTWAGIALAFAGLVCLAGPNAFHVGLGRGEVATVVSAVAIAAEILLISQFAGSVDSTRITVVQLLAAGLLSFAMMPIAGEQIPAFSWIWCASAIGLGIASAMIQLTMNWAQRSVSPARATIIYAGEPVWAGLVGRLAGDRLPALALLGALLIVAGVIVSELKPRSDPA